MGKDQSFSTSGVQADQIGAFTPQTEFETYDKTAVDYDTTRVTVGTNIILRRLKSTDRVLDLGCGTGNHLLEIAPVVAEAVGFEFNDGMLNQARQKLEGKHRNVKLMQGSLLDPLPFEDNSFDVVICTQVLHHLDHGAPFENTAKAIKEMVRVVRPDGIVGINYSTPQQQREGFWWARLIPEAAGTLSKRFTSLEAMSGICAAVGLKRQIHEMVPAPLQGTAYFNLSGVFLENWRNTDPTWSHVSDDELNGALNHMRRMMRDGTVGTFLAECEEGRMQVGQTMWSIASKNHEMRPAQQ